MNTRLYALMAREASVALVLLRGPRDWNHLVRWDTSADAFEPGAWFRGRIYEEKCDLSPDGQHLLYFAAKWTPRQRRENSFDSWTAVSRTPWLYALALWPNIGTWFGGGLFKNNQAIQFNSGPYPVPKPHTVHLPPSSLTVRRRYLGFSSEVARLRRDGWKVRRADHSLEKSGPNGQRLTLRRLESGPHRLRYAFSPDRRAEPSPLTGATWADFDQRGRLVFGRTGRLLMASFGENGTLEEVELADFSAEEPAPKVAPEWAETW